MADLYYSSVAQETQLSLGMDSITTSMTVGAVTGFPSQYPYKLIVGKDLPSEEVVYVVSAIGTTLTIERGKDGTVAQAHDIGAPVVHGADGDDFQRAANHRTATAGIHGLAPGQTPAAAADLADLDAAVAAHIGSSSNIHGMTGNPNSRLNALESRLNDFPYLRKAGGGVDQSPIPVATENFGVSFVSDQVRGDWVMPGGASPQFKVPVSGVYQLNVQYQWFRTNSAQTGTATLRMKSGVSAPATSGSIIRSSVDDIGGHAFGMFFMNDLVFLTGGAFYHFSVINDSSHPLQISSIASRTRFALHRVDI